MLNDKKVVVVMPAYNAGNTLLSTYLAINFWRSVKYGLGVLATSFKLRLQKMHFGSFKIFGAELPPGAQDYYKLVTR